MAYMNLTFHKALISGTYQEIPSAKIPYEVRQASMPDDEDILYFWENRMPEPQEGITYIVSESAFKFDKSLANRTDVVVGVLYNSEDGPYYYVEVS